ncbi:hypothetical protein PCANC_05438 [Puccinia coronata f. sp. avenae]|uniref:Uncharacterized protein n=1 Tax=Puccinia coronata f. sp. avenae TaxID=200324 RepID=A0A2N5T6Z3_9BASI|nr:hypothetical protein PCANC_05438 [Puccinia coronata f. sp. avenae]
MADDPPQNQDHTPESICTADAGNMHSATLAVSPMMPLRKLSLLPCHAQAARSPDLPVVPASGTYCNNLPRKVLITVQVAGQSNTEEYSAGVHVARFFLLAIPVALASFSLSPLGYRTELNHNIHAAIVQPPLRPPNAFAICCATFTSHILWR